MKNEELLINNYQSWGRYPEHTPKEVIRLAWREELPNFADYDGTLLPFGYGKSYGDSCQNSGGIIIDTKGMNKILAFNEDTGIIKCESGVTLADVLNFALPKGWFLASTPGTKLISVGGALGNDVHGKNHHKGGTFGCHVTQFELVRSNGEHFICSPTENKDLFAATIGGLGLTGLVTWVEFKLKPCPSEFFEMEAIKFDTLKEFFEINAESENLFDYTVSWIDTTAAGNNLGRGIYNRANHADPKKQPLPELPKEGVLPFPFDAPFINNLSVQAFNVLYYNKQIFKQEKNIVHYNPLFYPLDAVNNWNRAYGKNGFLQYQFVVPFGNDVQTIKEILQYISISGLSSFLTVLKTFGYVKSPGMLSFPRPGITLAVDFRMTGERTLKAIEEADKLVRQAGGRLYPAKDSRMSPEMFEFSYPNFREFEKYIDPKYSSSFWRRVTGTEAL